MSVSQEMWIGACKVRLLSLDSGVERRESNGVDILSLAQNHMDSSHVPIISSVRSQFRTIPGVGWGASARETTFTWNEPTQQKDTVATTPSTSRYRGVEPERNRMADTHYQAWSPVLTFPCPRY